MRSTLEQGMLPIQWVGQRMSLFLETYTKVFWEEYHDATCFQTIQGKKEVRIHREGKESTYGKKLVAPEPR